MLNPLTAALGLGGLALLALWAGRSVDRDAGLFFATGRPTPKGVLTGLATLGYPAPTPGEMLIVAIKNDEYQRLPDDPPDPWRDWIAHVKNDAGQLTMRISRGTVRPGRVPGSSKPWPAQNTARIAFPQYARLAYSGGQHPRRDPQKPDKVTRPAFRQVDRLWVEFHVGGGRWERLQQSAREGRMNQHGTRPSLNVAASRKNGVQNWSRGCIVTLDWHDHAQNLAFLDWRDDHTPRYHFAAITTAHIRGRR